jgi:hypothetical protein
MNDALTHFKSDLIAAGLEGETALKLQHMYEVALLSHSTQAWEDLYLHLFLALCWLPHTTGRMTIQRFDAREALLRLLEDDFGRRLFDDPTLERLRSQVAMTVSKPPTVIAS